MEPTLGERFRRSSSAQLEVNGRTVHALFERRLGGPEVVRLELRSSRPRPEGVCLKIVGGNLLINEQRLREAVLWTETAPGCVRIVCQPKETGAVLKVWNTWKDEQGTQHAWIGNAGMLAESTADGVILRCSDGIGDVDFEDLIVSLQFEPAAK
jgi:hypothetical protein